ncbi:hypothetical protein [Bernardetia sp.]|uniref:hypothetical protein n=1 Tax=Bernardetia sp. TaxID=1937974 RepID=UPI0025C5DA27|nr:hypothetical protein [Bernardetia sp.]
MVKYIILLLLFLINIYPSIAQDDYYRLFPKKAVIYGNTYEYDSIRQYYFSKDSVYQYEPVQKIFVNPESIDEWKKQQIEMDSLNEKFKRIHNSMDVIPRVRIPEFIYYNSFMDSLNTKYEQIKDLSNFYNLSNSDIGVLAQYCNVIDKHMFENKMVSKYKNNNPKYWIIPKVANDFKVKFDSLFDDFCRKNRQAYSLERPKALFTQTLSIAGYGGFEVLIDFYKTCPIKSECLKDEKVIMLKPYTITYCIFTIAGYGTPIIKGWPRED